MTNEDKKLIAADIFQKLQANENDELEALFEDGDEWKHHIDADEDGVSENFTRVTVIDGYEVKLTATADRKVYGDRDNPNPGEIIEVEVLGYDPEVTKLFQANLTDLESFDLEAVTSEQRAKIERCIRITKRILKHRGVEV